jgi:hypothetical protein
VETRDGTGKDLSEIDDKNQIEKRFISSQSFHQTPDVRIREVTAEMSFELGILKYFEPTNQQSYRKHPAAILTQILRDPHKLWKTKTSASSWEPDS